jgi:death on curing protein
MIYPTLDQIINDHELLIQQFGGNAGIKDMNLLESAYNNPLQTFSGIDLYPTIEEKFAVLCYGLAQNHSFHDGNKRIAVHVLIVGLYINKIKINYTQEDLIELGLNIAQGKCNKDCILDWIKIHL